MSYSELSAAQKKELDEKVDKTRQFLDKQISFLKIEEDKQLGDVLSIDQSYRDGKWIHESNFLEACEKRGLPSDLAFINSSAEAHEKALNSSKDVEKQYFSEWMQCVMSTFFRDYFDRQGGPNRAKSIPWGIRAKDISISMNGENDDITMIQIHNLGIIYMKNDLYQESYECFIEVLDVREEALGLENPLTLDTVNSLATLHCKMEEYENARRLYEQVTKIHLMQSGPDSLPYAVNLLTLAKVERLAKRSEKSAESFLSLANFHSRRGEMNRFLDYLATSACCWRDCGFPVSFSQQDICMDFLQLARERHDDQHKSTQLGVKLQGAFLKARGRFDEAYPYYLEYYERHLQTRGVDHRETQVAANNVATLLKARGLHSSAEEIYQNVLDNRTRVEGTTARMTLNAMNNVAMVKIQIYVTNPTIEENKTRYIIAFKMLFEASVSNTMHFPGDSHQLNCAGNLGSMVLTYSTDVDAAKKGLALVEQAYNGLTEPPHSLLHSHQWVVKFRDFIVSGREKLGMPNIEFPVLVSGSEDTDRETQREGSQVEHIYTRLRDD